jgi:hypothetical protein
MRRSLCIGVLAVALPVCGASPVQAQKLQQLFVSVADADGSPLTDLQLSDVEVMEDGVICKTVKLEPIDWPIKLIVLVDNGQATTNPITNLRTGLRGLFDAIPDGIEMSLLTTAPQPRTVVKPTTDKKKLFEGIDLVIPDTGAGAFFDSMAEAAQRIDKDKTPHFPVILSVATDYGRTNVLDRDYQRLQQNIVKHGITVHIVMMAAGGERLGSVAGAGQTEIGLQATKLSGGRYENINATTRLMTLLPELGQRIAKSHALQSHQFRLTYERPANAKPAPMISASISKPGNVVLSIDGHIP